MFLILPIVFFVIFYLLQVQCHKANAYLQKTPSMRIGHFHSILIERYVSFGTYTG